MGTSQSNENVQDSVGNAKGNVSASSYPGAASAADALDINGNFMLDFQNKQTNIKKRGKPSRKKAKRPQAVPKITVNSYTWTKESHGLFDYDLKDVLKVSYESQSATNVLRHELAVLFSDESQDHLIARIAQSGGQHWWIYHQFSYSGANAAFQVAKDTKVKQLEAAEQDGDPLDYIKEEDLFKNPERMLWKVVRHSYDAREDIKGHRLMKGDVIKIGRVRFKVREIVSPTYKKLEQKQKQQTKIYQQKIKKEMQQMLQEQLNTYRSQRIAKREQLEQETILRAQALSKRQHENERAQISERGEVQNTDDYHQMEESKTDNDYLSQNQRYTNKFPNLDGASSKQQLTFRNDLVKPPSNELAARFEENKHNQNLSIDNSQVQSNFNNITSSVVPVTAREPVMEGFGHHKTNTFTPARKQNINDQVPNVSEYSSNQNLNRNSSPSQPLDQFQDPLNKHPTLQAQNSAGRFSLLFNQGAPPQHQQLLTEYDAVDLGGGAENQNASPTQKNQMVLRGSANGVGLETRQDGTLRSPGSQENDNSSLGENEMIRVPDQDDRLGNEAVATRSQQDRLNGDEMAPDPPEFKADQKSGNASIQQSVSGSDMQDMDDMEDDEVIVLEADNEDFIDQDLMQYFERATSGGGAAARENLSQINEKERNSQDCRPNERDLEGVCRICLGEEDEPNTNPLFSPCICAGSMGLIHLECLKEWLKGKKIQRQGEIVSTYFWKNLECELCKQRFPIEIELKNKQKVAILDYELPVYEADEAPHYITLESISSNTSKVVHVLNLIDEDQISIGRGHEIAVRVTDISVSRCHAIIKKSPLGFYYILDNNSKFGTLSLVRQPQLINSTCNNFYQIGKTLISFDIEQFEMQQRQVCCLSREMEQRLTACMRSPGHEEDQKQRKVVEELIDHAPVKDELVTHDGVVYFPEELMPHDLRTNQESQGGAIGQKDAAQAGVVAPFIQKTKQLNLRLKFKNSKVKKALHLSQFKRQIEGHKSFATPNLGFMTHRNIPRSHTYGGGIGDPNTWIQNIGNSDDKQHEQHGEAAGGMQTSRPRYDQQSASMMKRLLSRKNGSLTHRGNRIVPMSSSLVEIPEMAPPDNNIRLIQSNLDRNVDNKAAQINNRYQGEAQGEAYNNNQQDQNNSREAQSQASRLSDANQPSIIPRGHSHVISGADPADKGAINFAITAAQNLLPLHSLPHNGKNHQQDGRAGGQVRRNMALANAASQDVLDGRGYGLDGEIAGAMGGHSSASQTAFARDPLNDGHRHIARHQDEAGRLILRGTPSRAESHGGDAPQGQASMRTDKIVFGDQYGTEPEMKIIDENGSPQDPEAAYDVPIQGRMPMGKKQPNSQIASGPDLGGHSQKKLRSDQYVRDMIPLNAKAELATGPLGGTGGAEAGNQPGAYGSLTSSGVYDDRAMGVDNSHLKEILAYRQDADNLVVSQRSAIVPEQNSQSLSEMGEDHLIPPNSSTPAREPAKGPSRAPYLSEESQESDKKENGQIMTDGSRNRMAERNITGQDKMRAPQMITGRASQDFEDKAGAYGIGGSRNDETDAHIQPNREQRNGPVRMSYDPIAQAREEYKQVKIDGKAGERGLNDRVQMLEGSRLSNDKEVAQNAPNTPDKAPDEVPPANNRSLNDISVLELREDPAGAFQQAAESQVEKDLQQASEQRPPVPEIPGQVVVDVQDRPQTPTIGPETTHEPVARLS